MFLETNRLLENSGQRPCLGICSYCDRLCSGYLVGRVCRVLIANVKDLIWGWKRKKEREKIVTVEGRENL